MKVLIVEDEPTVAASLVLGLRAEGFAALAVSDGVQGLRRVTDSDFDVVVLDIMLPGLNGYEVLRRMREHDVWTPVLMLTAKDGEFDETDAFDFGADDYLTKPFSFAVLLARLRALTRRATQPRPMILKSGSLSLDPGRRAVHRGDTSISLTPREFDVLEYLMRHQDTVVTKAAILGHVWDAHHRGPDNVVEVYIRYIRLKIDIPFGTSTIDTVRGTGYIVSSNPSATGSRTDTQSPR